MAMIYFSLSFLFFPGWIFLCVFSREVETVERFVFGGEMDIFLRLSNGYRKKKNYLSILKDVDQEGTFKASTSSLITSLPILEGMFEEKDCS